AEFERLDEGSIAITLRAHGGGDGALGLKFYHLGTAIPLSDRVPMLENFGFQLIDERTYTTVRRDGNERYRHDTVPDLPGENVDQAISRAAAIEAGISAVWREEAESDQLNSLVTLAGLDWSQAALLRAVSRYLRQVGTSYSQRYITQVLVNQRTAASA